MNTSASQRENSLTSKPKVKLQRQNSQENIAVRGDLVGGNQNVPRGQRAHELSDSSGDEAEQPARVKFLLYFCSQFFQYGSIINARYTC